jgi:hypothetical protein
LQNNMRASIKAQVILIDDHGKVIWKNDGWIGGAETQMEIRPIEEWIKDPEGLRKAFEETARILSAELLKEYKAR